MQAVAKPSSTVNLRQSYRQRRSVLSATNVMNLTGDDTHELERKAADHEALVQRFQLRRASTGSVSVGKLVSSSVGDATWMGCSARVASGNLGLLDRRMTWVQTLTAPLIPGHFASTCHDILMLGAYHLQVFYLPFAYTFYPNGSVETVRTGLTLQIIHLVDLILNLNTAFVRKRKLVTSRREIAQNHITKWFALELVSAVPVSIVFGFEDNLPQPIPWTLLNYDAALIALRLLRAAINAQQFCLSHVLRENKHLASWFQYSRYSHLLGIAKLMWLTVLVAHYMACLWHIVAKHHDTVASVAEQYIADVYYAVQLTQGQGGVSGTLAENLLSTVVILAGSVILAIVFGNVALLVSSFNANKVNLEQKMHGVFATMDKMGLPLKLRDRVQQYYAHVWMEYDDVVKFKRELTHSLRLEVRLFKYMELIGKVAFWEHCSSDFVMQIIRNLGVRVYLPDDFVVRKDEIGDEMFMINRGICILSDTVGGCKASPVSDRAGRAVRAPSNSSPRRLSQTLPWWGESVRAHVHPTKISTYEVNSDCERNGQVLLHPGQAFGELSLLMNYKRTATIRAQTYVETCTLDRATFQRVISRYHEDRRIVLATMLRGCIDRQELPSPLGEVAGAVTDRIKKKKELSGSSRESGGIIVTSTEIVEGLVAWIDESSPDETIKYGFQEAKLAQFVACQDEVGRKLSSEDALGAQHDLPSDSDGRTASPKETTAIETRLADVERKLAAIVDLIGAVSASVERLEMHAKSRNEGSCASCPNCSATRTSNGDLPRIRPSGSPVHGYEATLAPSIAKPSVSNGEASSNSSPSLVVPPKHPGSTVSRRVDEVRADPDKQDPNETLAGRPHASTSETEGFGAAQLSGYALQERDCKRQHPKHRHNRVGIDAEDKRESSSEPHATRTFQPRLSSLTAHIVPAE